MAKTNTPLFVVRNAHPKYPLRTVIFKDVWETTDGKMYELADDSYVGKRMTPTVNAKDLSKVPTYPG